MYLWLGKNNYRASNRSVGGIILPFEGVFKSSWPGSCTLVCLMDSQSPTCGQWVAVVEEPAWRPPRAAPTGSGQGDAAPSVLLQIKPYKRPATMAGTHKGTYVPDHCLKRQPLNLRSSSAWRHRQSLRFCQSSPLHCLSTSPNRTTSLTPEPRRSQAARSGPPASAQHTHTGTSLNPGRPPIPLPCGLSAPHTACITNDSNAPFFFFK